ncbi:MAG: 1-hydroxycarotenoid 3,4-desaturase CrtD [Bacteroidota bacterium]
MSQKVIVIGSGIAGLSAALRLRKKGYDVTVFESNAYPGGKLHAFESRGYQFDYGPSLFTMPHLVDELFDLYELDSEQYFHYQQKDTICNYFWDDGTQFTVDADEQQFVAKAATTFTEPEAHIEKYLKNSRTKYDRTASIFLEKSLHKFNTYLSKETLKALFSLRKLDLLGSLNGVNESYFSNPKLVQLFNRYATYNGSNPYHTPGIMSLIPQLEMRFGTFYPTGGMHSITKSLHQLAVEQGISFHFNERVEEVLTDGKKTTGIRTGKDQYEAQTVVCNMDVFSAYQTLLKKEKKPNKILAQERSSSALIFYWGIKKTFNELDLHNIFFSNDYPKEFDFIFNKRSLFDDPTVYLNITSKEEPSQAPDGCENWFVMINAPGNDGQDWESLKAQSKINILKKLSMNLGEAIEPLIETETVLDPVRIETETLSHQGSLYGTSSNSKLAAFLRHPNFSSTVENLYFCGGSAHPGGGIPLCLLSAKIVSDLIPNSK